MLSSTAGCLLTGAGQAAETHASLQSPDGRLSWRLHAGSQAAHSLKKAANDSGTIRAGRRREWKNLAGGITGWNVEK